MSISFPKATGSVQDGKVFVVVRCNGTETTNCVGTLKLKVGGKTTKTSFSVKTGKKKKIAVPLPSSVNLQSGGKATATAVTNQVSGAPVKSTKKLSLK
jgi:hypothetical protein